MNIFSKEKRKKTPLESYVENLAYSISREAKNDGAERAAIVGRDNFIAEQMRRFDSVMVHLDYPLTGVEYRLIRSPDLPGEDVCFYVPARGNAALLQYVGGTYRLQGNLNAEGSRLFYLHYRGHQFKDAEALKRLFEDDIEVLRKFLYDVEQTMERFRIELRRQLNIAVADLDNKIVLANELMTDLKQLGFKPRQ